MKILFLDIETAPNLATVWGLFKQHLSHHNLIESSYVLCWAAKWYGEDITYFDSVYRSTPKAMLKRIHAMLSEADAVVHYNGTKFDIPTLNKEFLLNNIPPPAPYKQIDLLKTSRNRFRFPTHRLDYVAKALGLEGKVEHMGHEMWLRCMNKDPEAWSKMEEYNIGDVTLLESVYDRMLPWIKGHANHSVFSGEEVCPHCGGKHYQKRGFLFTLAGKYQRYQCKDCKTWFRGSKNEAGKAKFLTSGI